MFLFVFYLESFLYDSVLSHAKEKSLEGSKFRKITFKIHFQLNFMNLNRRLESFKKRYRANMQMGRS